MEIYRKDGLKQHTQNMDKMDAQTGTVSKADLWHILRKHLQLLGHDRPEKMIQEKL